MTQKFEKLSSAQSLALHLYASGTAKLIIRLEKTTDPAPEIMAMAADFPGHLQKNKELGTCFDKAREFLLGPLEAKR